MITPDTKPPGKNPVIDEYTRIAPDYDKKWSFYIDATTRETVARLNLRPTDRVLDVGCGTGSLLYYLVSSYPKAQLSGIDLVPEMLAIARRRLPPSIELREGSVEHLPFEDEQFDIVVSCSMFHYIHNPITALRQIHRVLRSGGQLVITDWCDDYIACRICDLYLRLFNRAHFKTYGKKECLRLLEEADYTEVKVESFKINWLWGLMIARAKKYVA
ncbi:MAG: methyltransferase domain-containing protein [Proteobacteria bacterium]|nr:methyltransferase domain-containing protein [Pseudomonadota bacterium]